MEKLLFTWKSDHQVLSVGRVLPKRISACCLLEAAGDETASLYLVYASQQHLRPAVTYRVGDQGDPSWVLSNHIPLLAPAGQSSSRLFCGRTVQTFSAIPFVGRNFINIPYLEASEPHKFISVLFCVKVSTLTLLYICRWNEICFRVYCWVNDGLFAHLPLHLFPVQFILCWFYVVMVQEEMQEVEQSVKLEH